METSAPSPESEPRRQRGILLSLFLLFFIIGSPLSVVSALLSIADSQLPGWLILIVLFNTSLLLPLAIEAWNWNKLGVYGIGILYVLAPAIAALAGTEIFQRAAVAHLPLLMILVILAWRKWKLFSLQWGPSES